MSIRQATPRPFLLMVDSGNENEPANRYFASLNAALKAAREYPEHFQPFVWIGELFPGQAVAKVHVRDGKPVRSES